MIIRQNLMSRFRIWGSYPRTLLGRLRRADVPCECPLIGVDRKWLADRQNDAGPISDVGIAGHRPTILLYEHSVSPSPGGAS
jgi:hypothetical protein